MPLKLDYKAVDKLFYMVSCLWQLGKHPLYEAGESFSWGFLGTAASQKRVGSAFAGQGLRNVPSRVT